MSPIYPQQNPWTSPQKSPIHPHKTALYLRTKEPYIWAQKTGNKPSKRALCMCTVLLSQIIKHLPVSKEPYTSTKEPYISATKEPYRSATKPWIKPKKKNESTKESSNKPYVCAQSLIRYLRVAQSLTEHVPVSKMPYLSTKEPYINGKSPETSP